MLLGEFQGYINFGHMDNLKEGGSINDRHENKNKSITFISNSDEGILDEMVILGT